jgi:phage minor structural protein
MSVLGHATTNLPDGYVIKEDLKTEDVNTGVASFSCTIGFTAENRTELEVMTNAGNYLLRSNGNENEFYTVIESEIDTLRQEIYIYAEDAGLDLINEIADEFEASEAHAAEWYIDKYIIDSGFEIGINEIPASTQLKLKWEGQSTVTERLASIATQFGGCEIAYSFAIKGLEITHKYVNIYKQRGQDNGVQLRLNKEVDKIITSRSVANLATAFICTGGVPDDSDEAITLNGYEYDDGDFYVDANGKLKSRKAVAKWSRYVWNKEPNKLDGYEGHIVRPYSYNTTSQSELCNRAITELKKYCDMEVNFEANIKVLPAGVKIGDRVNIIDDAGGLYLSTRLLKLETSITEQKYTATLGEHLIKGSGISQKVADLAAQFSAYALSAERALKIAKEVKATAEEAYDEAVYATELADSAWMYADSAGYSASEALTQAGNALDKSTTVEQNVNRISDEVYNLGYSVRAIGDTAQEAYEYAYDAIEAAAQAQGGVESAYLAAQGAGAAANQAKASADSAYSKAVATQVMVDGAYDAADEAKTIANAAKSETAQALKEIDSLGDQLVTLSNTMKADYVSDGKFSSVTEGMQTQISQNAHDINFSAIQTIVIDETANNAKEKADLAQELATKAQEEADKASAAADDTQKAADEASAAALVAQSEADKANLAAKTAKDSADQAEDKLTQAKEDLEAVKGRIDATEGEIATAQEAVKQAQSEADTAKAAADKAAAESAAAQSVADTAKAEADEAKAKADAAAEKADTAQALADAAKGDASAAQNTANEAVNTATKAQETADAAVSTAETAQGRANEAAENAAAAQKIADAAKEKSDTAQSELEAAKENLEAVKGRIDATEEEIAKAEEAVAEAQKAADLAQLDAKAAQDSADTAKEFADAAQKEAEEARIVADLAQKAAEDAKKAADAAQAAADALAVRLITAEAKIEQTATAVTLSATKDEIEERLSGFYSREESDALFRVQAESITSSVKSTYATILDMDESKKEIVAAATVAQSEANQAKAAAAIAQSDADAAKKEADAAQSELDAAKANLADVTGRVDATEGEIAEAQRLVDEAQKAADDAVKKAADAQDLADIAQESANVAKERADNAQAEADALATRTAVAETLIEQTSEQIKLTATKQELQIVSDNLGENYYTATQTDSKIEQKAGEITQTVSSEYATAAYVRIVNDTAQGALETATQAQGGVESAYLSAQAAGVLANEAKETANNASGRAVAAQNIADALAIRVGTAESKITQTQDSISSLVTKTETIESKIGDYYTKTETESKIEQTADAIRTQVSGISSTIEEMNAEKAEIVAVAADAQATAALAAGDALKAKQDAEDAVKELEEAQKNLAAAEKALEELEGKADANAAEIAAAQKTADDAKDAVDDAKEAADKAAEVAAAAKDAADAAQAAADALAGRVSVAETWIEQTSEQIASFATKQDFEGYYTKSETDSAITQKADEITLSVSSTYATSAEMRVIGDTAQGALETATQAQGGAESAYLAAQGAAGAAKEAQAAAEAAQSTANTANATANRAEGKADAAQDELTQVSAAVTTHTTQIQSLEQSINLKASMTEVKDHLSKNYYDKDYLESNFKVTPDSIISSVSHHFTTKEEFDNLEIGGANLLANSDVEIYGELTEGSTSAVVRYGDLMPAFDKYGLGVYTLSFDIKAVVEDDKKATVVVSCGDGAQTSKHTFPNRIMSDVTGEYERRSFSFSPKIEHADGTNSMLKFQSGAGIYVKDVKLEKGTKPTTWTPASEDVYDKIDGVSDSVDDIDKRVTLAESTIRQLKDAIQMLVVDSNGQSLMTQTSTGWVFSTKSIQEQLSSASEGLATLQGEVGDTKSAVEILDAAVKDLGVLSEYIKIGTYTYTDDEGIEQTEPSIDLGETDTGFRLKITNTRILFTDGSENLVEINSRDKSLDIGKARIKNELQMGGFVWQARSNGNLGLVWKGANS